MYKNLRWKVLTIIIVVGVFFTIGVYPLLAERYHMPLPQYLKANQLKLGLDLKGGVHLVLRVNTDDALKLTSTTTSEQLRESLRSGNIPVTNIVLEAPTRFRVEGVPPDRDSQFRQAADEITATNYNRNPLAGGAYEFTMKPLIERDLREQAVDQALQTIDRRVNELGVAEPSIARQPQGDQILVQLPGVTDVARAKEIIRSTAILEFKLVEAGPSSSKDDLLKQYNGQLPGEMEILQGSAERGGTDTGPLYYVVRKIAPVTGQDLRVARPGLDENNQPAVHFELKSGGAQRFGKLSGENIGRYLAIVLDNRVVSAPRLEGRITDQGRISGGFTTEMANDLSLTLRAGALPASLTYLEERVVGPTLGQDSIRSGVIASATGLALIVVFMLVYYKLSGVNAIVALIFNLVILIGLMAYVGATMTLPGIAGFVLTMGVGVDSNVLIFERIKEELAAQRGVRASINAGFSRVFLTLLDTHVAALISAAFLFQFGTGPIRGFATTLSIGLMVNLFTSIFVSKTIYELELSARKEPALSI
ncbi:MAG: protein translocase subunit SecD [Acidobacteria bacterium]|nr:MAG: protein translocase subunit SecD [Acidobacteriota bacterium]